jgi:rRNA processing protein Gar1
MSGRIVSHIGNQAVVEMSGREIPDLGWTVSSGGKKIGSVFDVIGSVRKPYVVVRLSSKGGRDIDGCTVSWGGKNG